MHPVEHHLQFIPPRPRDMRVLLVGASGFIGRSIAIKTPEHVELTGTYYRNKPEIENIRLEQFNFLDTSVDWSALVEQYDCIIIAARANGDTESNRNEVSKQASDAFTRFIGAVQECESKPFIVTLNGSLSYGECGEKLVKTDDQINPTGYARSYAIAEKPLRDFLSKGQDVAIIRAPWVIGASSWFPMMYLHASRIPIIGSGMQWMSLVSVDDLAEYIWKAVASSKSGVLHPQLTYRCRQMEFAEIVHEVTSKKKRRIGILRRQRMEIQMRESVLASIRLDDGFANQSEEQTNRERLKSFIEEIHSGFS